MSGLTPGWRNLSLFSDLLCSVVVIPAGAIQELNPVTECLTGGHPRTADQLTAAMVTHQAVSKEQSIEIICYLIFHDSTTLH